MQRRWLGLGFGALGIGLVGGVAWFGPRLVAARLSTAIEAEASRQVDADVTFESVAVDFWSSFPRVDAVITDLSVVNRAPFAGTELFAADAVRVGVDLGSLFGGPIGVRALIVRHPRFAWVTDAEGRSNLDVWRSEGGAGGAWAVDLDEVDVQDLHVEITDASGSRVVLDDVDHHLTGRASSDAISLSTVTTAGAVSVTLLGVDWLREAKVAVDADVDRVGDRFTLTKGALVVNALAIKASGSAVSGADGTRLDGSFQTADTAFGALLSLVPGAYGPAFSGVDAKGTLALTGTVAGLLSADRLTYPGFDAKLSVVDGAFQYPGLPAKVDGVALTVAVTHAEGPIDGVVVDVPDARLSLDGRPVVARLRVAHPMTDPEIDVGAEGDLDLARLAAAFPEGTGATGRVAGKVALAGRWSDLVSGDVAAVQASGDVRAEGLSLVWSALGSPVSLELLDASLSNNAAEVRRCVARTGASDAAFTGQVVHPLAWALGAGTLAGHVEVVSDRVDLDHLWADTGEASGVALVPTQLALDIKIRAGEVISSGISAKNVAGTVRLRDGVATFEALRLDLMGGKMSLTGSYAAPSPDGAVLDLDIDAAGFDVASSTAAFTSLSKLAPTLASATGRYDTAARLAGKLGADGSLDLATVVSEGQVDSHGISLRPAILSRVAKAVGDPSLDGVSVDGARMQFRMKDGKLEIDRMPLLLGGTAAALSGFVDVPSTGLDLALGFAAATQGLGDLAVGAVGARTDVVVRLIGLWDDPKVKVELSGIKDVVAAVKDKVADAVSDAVARADAEGERLIAQAERARDELVAVAQAEAKKLKAGARREGAKLEASASNPIAAAAAKEARKKLEDKADVAAKKVVIEAQAKGDGLVDEARKKKAALVGAAQQ